jgi:hypothetical protein
VLYVGEHSPQQRVLAVEDLFVRAVAVMLISVKAASR